MKTSGSTLLSKPKCSWSAKTFVSIPSFLYVIHSLISNLQEWTGDSYNRFKRSPAISEDPPSFLTEGEEASPEAAGPASSTQSLSSQSSSAQSSVHSMSSTKHVPRRKYHMSEEQHQQLLNKHQQKQFPGGELRVDNLKCPDSGLLRRECRRCHKEDLAARSPVSATRSPASATRSPASATADVGSPTVVGVGSRLTANIPTGNASAGV